MGSLMTRDQCANVTDPAKKYIFENEIHQIFNCHNPRHDTDVS